MNEQLSDFQQTHSPYFLAMASCTDKQKIPENYNGYGRRTGDCGDTIEIFLKVNSGYLESVCFNIDGCVNTMACANTVVYFAEGKPVDDAWKISPEMVIQYLKTLPSDHAHCAELAVGALYLALADYQKIKLAS